jgi:GDP-mannose 6-dehydrogenase
MVRATGKKRVGILGLSFKPGTDDLRESPMVALTETLLGKGYEIRIFDRNVSLSQLVGSNRRFIEREIPHLQELMCESLEEVVNHSEVIVVGYHDPSFLEEVVEASKKRIVIDLVRLSEDTSKLGEGYRGICW